MLDDRIKRSDLHSLRMLRSSPGFARALEEMFAEHCAERRRKVAAAEIEAAEAQSLVKSTADRARATQRALDAARDHTREAMAAHFRAMSASLAASSAADGIEGRLRRALAADAHPDIQEVLLFVLDVHERVRHTARSGIAGGDRNALGQLVRTYWTNTDKVAASMAELDAIAGDLRTLVSAAYSENLPDVLRSHYRRASSIARAHDVRPPTITTVEGIEAEQV